MKVRAAKVRLAREVGRILRKRKAPQREIASLLGVSQPDVSKLKRGQVKNFSMDRLCQFLAASGRQVVISIRRRPSRQAPAIKVESNV